MCFKLDLPVMHSLVKRFQFNPTDILVLVDSDVYLVVCLTKCIDIVGRNLTLVILVHFIPYD